MAWATIRKPTIEDYEILDTRLTAFCERHSIVVDQLHSRYDYEMDLRYRIQDLQYAIEWWINEGYVLGDEWYRRQLATAVWRRAIKHKGADIGIAYGYLGYSVQ